MPAETAHSSPTDVPGENLVIHCPDCEKSVAAPASMIGQLVECPYCRHHFTIELPPAPPAPSGRDPEIIRSDLASFEGQLKENLTQITELRGHVSRLNMEMHRHQLRMKNLTDRQVELQTEIAAAKNELGAD